MYLSHRILKQALCTATLIVTSGFVSAGELPDLGEPDNSGLSNTEVAKEAAMVGLLIVDYAQTRSINGFCDDLVNCTVHETNPLLGGCPGAARTRNYFLGMIGAHIAITNLLPQEYRSAWQNAGLALEVVITARNARLGLRMKF